MGRLWAAGLPVRGLGATDTRHLRSRRRPELALYMAEALPSPDAGLATRLALKGLAGSEHLVVLYDYHVVDEDRAIPGGPAGPGPLSARSGRETGASPPSV